MTPMREDRRKTTDRPSGNYVDVVFVVVFVVVVVVTAVSLFLSIQETEKKNCKRGNFKI